MVYSFQSSATIKGIGKYIFMILNGSFSVLGIVFTAFSTFTRVLILWCLRILWCVTFSCFFMLFYCWWTFFLYNWWRLIPKTASTICRWDWRRLMIFAPWLLWKLYLFRFDFHWLLIFIIYLIYLLIFLFLIDYLSIMLKCKTFFLSILCVSIDLFWFFIIGIFILIHLRFLLIFDKNYWHSRCFFYISLQLLNM